VVPQVPTPPADGPKLVAIEHGAVVRDRPSPNGKVIGTLAAGAQVARAAEPYSTRSCAGGWYPIRPRGFVCAGEGTTLDVNHPVAKLLAGGPSLERPLPYRYGRARRGAAVIYDRLPSHDDQLA